MTIGDKDYTLAEIMRPPVLVASTSTLRDALATLVDRRTNMGVVVDDAGVFLGTVTTLDIISAVLPDYLEADNVAARFADDALLREDTNKAATMPVCDFLDRDEATIDADAHLMEATVLASKDATGRIVVLDDARKPVGVLTRTEIKMVLAAYLGIRNEIV